MDIPVLPTIDLPFKGAFGEGRTQVFGDFSETRNHRPLPDLAYKTKPIEWMVDVLGIEEATLRWSLNPEYAEHQWDGSTPDPLVVAAEAVANYQWTGVESCIGSGKTFFGAALALWFLVTRDNPLVITTAPSEKQLKEQLWRYMGTHWPAFKRSYPLARWTDLRVRLKDPESVEGEARETWAIIGWVAKVEVGRESAAGAQGFHAPEMLCIIEEFPGVEPAVAKALTLTASGERNVVYGHGNPDHQADALHQHCLSPSVCHVRISAYDLPNIVCGREVVAGASGPRWLAKQKHDLGIGTPLYDSRVRGVAPEESTHALIRWEWLRAAVAQSANGDRSSKARWEGRCLEEVVAERCLNATRYGEAIATEAKLLKIKPEHIGVDPVGVGAAAFNALRDEFDGGTIVSCGGAEGTVLNSQRAPSGQLYDWVADGNLFLNLRAQMFWQMREDLRLGEVGMIHDEELFRELTTITYTIRANKVVLDDKEKFKKLLGRSPDKADSVVYGNWARRRWADRPVEVKRDQYGNPIVPTGFVPFPEDGPPNDSVGEVEFEKTIEELFGGPRKLKDGETPNDTERSMASRYAGLFHGASPLEDALYGDSTFMNYGE